MIYKLFSLFIYQGNLEIKKQLGDTTGYDKPNYDQDGTMILMIIKGIMYVVENHLQRTCSIVKSD